MPQIEVKVKTLNSRDFTFKVEDEKSVAEMKAQIAEEIGISADRQRLIYRFV